MSERNSWLGYHWIFLRIISAIVVSVFMSGWMSYCHGHQRQGLASKFDA